MPYATRVELSGAVRAATSALHIFVDAQYVLALTAQHSAFTTPWKRPYCRLVMFKSVVAAYTGVEFEAARVANCDDIACGVPVFALGQWRDGYAMNLNWGCC